MGRPGPAQSAEVPQRRAESEPRPLTEDTRARHAVGDRVGSAVLSRALRVVPAGEIWQGALPTGDRVAVKVWAHGPGVRDGATREAVVLWQLGGGPAPRLVHSELAGDLPRGVAARLVTSWVDGVGVDLAARRLGDVRTAGRARRELVVAVDGRYADLHDRGVLHGTVHPDNLLVASDGTVTVLDFGAARLRDGGLDPVPRAVHVDYLEPEAAAALQVGAEAPPVSEAGEQYSVAALLWGLLTGAPYLELPASRHDALTSIRTRSPMPLEVDRAGAWPAGEAALRRALSKAPVLRHRSMRALHAALVNALGPAEPRPAVALTVAAFEVDRPSWRRASRTQAAQVAELLRKVAALSGDVDVTELAAAWALRAGPCADPPLTTALGEAHRCLQAYRRTGDRRALRGAVRLARTLPPFPAGWETDLPGPREPGGGPLARLTWLLGQAGDRGVLPVPDSTTSG
ncbi:MAG: hypothetical protein JWL64_893 [Frankiales bacterium]|nr:hypothetical protein [Frankiales bacterium]